MKLKLKWNKLSFDLELNNIDTAIALKRKVYELTKVPESKQKLMAKNVWQGTLKDDQDMKLIHFGPNQSVMLMGTPETTSGGFDQITISFSQPYSTRRNSLCQAARCFC